MLSNLGRLKAHPGEFAQALPELLTVLKIERKGIADLYGAVHKITRYNEAAHDQFARQIEVVRTLVDAVKEQEKVIRQLTRRVESLEKKLEKRPGSNAPAKKTGWFR